MKASELRDLSDEALVEELERLYKELFNARMSAAIDQLPQVHLLKETRREIARVKTIQGERTRV